VKTGERYTGPMGILLMLMVIFFLACNCYAKGENC